MPEYLRAALSIQTVKVDLFLATPADLALLFGHLWDRMPDTQIYLDLATPATNGLSSSLTSPRACLERSIVIACVPTRRPPSRGSA